MLMHFGSLPVKAPSAGKGANGGAVTIVVPEAIPTIV
jgi:hypothetical protein